MAKVSLRIISFPRWLSTLVDDPVALVAAQFKTLMSRMDVDLQAPPNMARATAMTCGGGYFFLAPNFPPQAIET
jgi:hypothetical protein